MRPTFKVKKASVRAVQDRIEERGAKPLYAGVVSKATIDHYGHPSTISLPLIRWMEKR
jgi:hypothetical protein